MIWDKAGERIMAEAAECAATIPRYGRLSDRAQWLSVTGRTRADAQPLAQQLPQARDRDDLHTLPYTPALSVTPRVLSKEIVALGQYRSARPER